MNKKDVLFKRRELIKQASKKQLFKSGDKRVTNGTRVCAVCQRRLTETSVVTKEIKPDTYINVFRTQSILKHYVLTISDILKVGLCYDAQQCVNHLKKKGKED